MSEKSIRPLDFIVIGAAKSGTTTLFYNLQHHPQVYLPPGKEAPFFSSDQRLEQGWQHYIEAYFVNAPPDNLWGTITPQYMDDPRAPERIYTLLPQIKLIAILRNPIDRAVSHYWHTVRKGIEDRSFEEAVSEQLSTESITRARTLAWGPSKRCYLIKSEYGRILQHFQSYFPAEQLLVLFTDDLKQRPQFLLDTLLSFIGLEPGFCPPNLGRQYHVGGSRQRFPWLVAAKRKVWLLKWLWETLPTDIREKIWIRFHMQLNVVQELPPKLSPDLRQQLNEFYRPDVLDLESLIGQKVPWQEFHL